MVWDSELAVFRKLLNLSISFGSRAPGVAHELLARLHFFGATLADGNGLFPCDREHVGREFIH